MLALFVAQYAPGGGGGSGISYGPVFWIVAALILIAVVAVAVWGFRRRRTGRSHPRSTGGLDEAA
jgi:hypothetical protein